MKDCLNVQLNGVPVGAVVRRVDGRVVFEFSDSYLNNPNRSILSQSFVGVAGGVRNRERASSSGQVPSFFSNLLPEGQLLNYLANAAGVRETQEFELLEFLGADLPGAVVVSREDERSERPIQPSADVSDSDDLRFSLAGVQLKLSALVKQGRRLTIPAQGLGGDWIVKLPSAAYARMPENEYSVMMMASRVGIAIPETYLVPVGEIEGLPREFADIRQSNAIAIRRFDRGLGRRIHAEDFAQAFGQRPIDKYNPQLNYTDVTQLVAHVCGENDAIDVSKRLMFSAIVGNGDMHLKNWSFIYPDGRKPELSPAYDFLCTTVYLPEDDLALKLGSARHWKNLTLDDFNAVADGAGLDRDSFVNAAVETVLKFREGWDDCAKSLEVDQALKHSIERQMRTCPAIVSVLEQTSQIAKR
ncbi:MAG: HipA domain-containing protein [Gammaproteobacteria bacterium]|nr:HipA domain-containing protein [Gammaproteobacteria bacterium]